MTIQTWKGKTRMCYCAKNKGGKEGKNLKKENEGEKAFFENILALIKYMDFLSTYLLYLFISYKNQTVLLISLLFYP